MTTPAFDRPGPESADVVVVGAGIAGLSAALRMVESDLDVVLVEQGAGPDYPCNSRMTGGAFHVAMGAVERDPDEVVGVMSKAGSASDPELIRAIAATAPRVIAWLRGHGVPFIRGGPLPWQRWVLAPPNLARPGYDFRGRAGDHALRTLTRAFLRRGGRLYTGCRAVAIRRDGDVVRGVELEAADGPEFAACRAVLLADGGFQADRELVNRHIAPHPDLVVARGGASGRGDGLRMAQAIGAATSDLTAFYGHLLARESLANSRLSPFPFVDYLALAGIMVDGEGRRPFDEGRGGVHLANLVARRTSRDPIHVVFDQRAWEGAGRAPNCPCNPYLARERSGLVVETDLAALAVKIGVDVDGFLATIAGYNAALAAKRQHLLVPPRSTDRVVPLPIAEPPYFAIPVCAGLTYTMGGVITDAAGRVVDADRRAIPGVYAAGTTVGGIEGGARIGYMGGLARSVATALLAADAAADALRPRRTPPPVATGSIHVPGADPPT